MPADLAPRLQPQATRFTGKLWTLCDELDPERGFCMSVAQARELWVRFREDESRAARLVIDVLRQRDGAVAELAEAQASAMRAVLYGSIAAVLTLLAGAGAGILIGHYVLQPR